MYTIDQKGPDGLDKYEPSMDPEEWIDDYET